MITDQVSPNAQSSRVVAPVVTRVAALVIMVGVLVQAGLAGGFLAGHRTLTDIHMAVGVPLILSAIIVVAVGLVGRRSSGAPVRLLVIRIAVLVALVATALVGLAAGGGTRDLLILHIPLAIISMGLAAQLVGATRT